jgi:peptidyl-prolyl cis-trans isomerase C
MLEKISPRLTPLCLGLCLLLALAAGCKNPPETEETATPETAKTAPASTPSQPATAAPAPADAGKTSGTPSSPAAETPMEIGDLPDVVAKVNGQAIKKRELLAGAQVVQIRLAQMGRPLTPSAEFYRQVLDQLIALILLQQDARAHGVTASEQEIQGQIDARKGSFPNEAAYHKALAQSGVTEETLRQQASDQISVQKYVQTKLAPDVKVSEQATREYYEQHKANIRTPERLHLRHILIRADAKTPAAEKAKAKQKAEDLLKRLQAGEDFARVAMENSQDPGTQLQGGDLGWVIRGQTVPPFEKAAFALTKPNQLSPVVESPYGFHIILLVERQPAAAVPYEKAKDRIGAMLKEQQVQQQVEARVRELRAKGKVEVFISSTS